MVAVNGKVTALRYDVRKFARYVLRESILRVEGNFTPKKEVINPYLLNFWAKLPR
jgi:hypothetical protein